MIRPEPNLIPGGVGEGVEYPPLFPLLLPGDGAAPEFRCALDNLTDFFGSCLVAGIAAGEVGKGAGFYLELMNRSICQGVEVFLKVAAAECLRTR